jgi:allantoinase
MSLYDLVIRHGMLVTEAAVCQADLGIADGVIVAIAPEISGAATDDVDARGLHIFPGVVDPHVHFDEPGRTDWEGFERGSAAFAVGGGTTYFDMPLNAHPPTTTGASFDAKVAAARARSLTDFALWGGIVPGNLDHLNDLAERGVVGFKAFMSRTGTDDFPAADDLTLYEGMARAATLSLPVAVHAENDQLTGALAARAIVDGRLSMRDYLASRPVVAEVEAIGRAIAFAEMTGSALHVVHVSTGWGVALVAEANARGLDISCETCPHYLVFTDEDAARLGAVAKCAPPLRPRSEREALWAHLLGGTLPIVASDHSPAPPRMRMGDDFFATWGGIAGCQSTLAAVLTAGAVRGLPLPTAAALLAGNTARRFKLSGKGRITEGADADLALVDLSHEARLTVDDLLYRHQVSPYVGRILRGRVMRTLVRGRTVAREGRIIGAAGGQLVRPSLDAPLGTPQAGAASTDEGRA